MQLGVREAAAVLKVSEKTIYRWVKEGKLPAYKINEQYRFNKAQLLEWATSQKLQVSPDIFREDDDAVMPGFAQALEAGGVFYRIGGSDKAQILKNVVGVMPLPDEVDRSYLLDMIMAREMLGSTGIGDGIAIPHVRNPIVMHIPKPMITLCFLESPVDFGAIDGKPVTKLFTIVSPTIKAHLHLLSRMAFVLKEPAFADAMATQASKEKILELARAAESQCLQGDDAARKDQQ